MARPLRLEFEDALYHVTSRGDRHEPIFEDDTDRRRWLAIAARGFSRFNATAFAYCLMGNHYHLVLQTHHPNLSRLMRHLNGVYTQAYNRRHGRIGHVFQGRFKAVLVDSDDYFLEVCRYVDLNPVRAGIVRRPSDWPWSSYRAHIGRVAGPPWLETSELHGRLASLASRGEGPRRYAEFVAQGLGTKLWETGLRDQIFLGDEEFAKRMQARMQSRNLREIPRTQLRPIAHPVEYYLSRFDRDMAIVRAFREGGHTQAAIAHAAGLSASRVSRLIAAREARSKT